MVYKLLNLSLTVNLTIFGFHDSYSGGVVNYKKIRINVRIIVYRAAFYNKTLGHIYSITFGRLQYIIAIKKI